MRTPYQTRIEKLAQTLASSFAGRTRPISIDFAAPHTRGRRPGDANSEFLANRGMGDWAEGVLHAGLNYLPGYHVVKYGNDSNMIAGNPEFPKFYDEYQDELARTGKRPDLLLFKEENYDRAWGNDISNLSMQELGQITPRASFGIEVRSSKFFALEYAAIRAEESKTKAGHRTSQSFTTKIEDLRIVKRWIDTYGVKHFYAQVFLDSVFMIPFEEILRLVGTNADGVNVEINARNQGKPTIHLPVTYGRQIAAFDDAPKFEAKTRKTRLARLDAYVKPVGGKLTMDFDAVTQTFSSEVCIN